MKKNMVLSILSIVLAVSMLTMTGCGGGGKTPSSASSADMSALANLLGGSTNAGNTGGGGTAAPVSAESVTKYECISAEMYEVELDLAEMFTQGVSMDLRADGSATFHYDTTDFEMKWTLNGDLFHVEDQYNAMDGTLKDGVLVLNDVLNSSMTMTFIDRNVADESTIAALTAPKLDLEMIGKYEGDWFGELVFQDGTGGYEQWIGTETLVMARFSFDEEGKLTPWLFAAVSDLNNNFKNVTGEIDEILNEAFLHYDFFYAEMDTENVYVNFDGDVMVMYPTFDRADGKGSFQARIAMKRLHEEWTDEEAEMYPFAPPLVAETLAYDNVEDLASAFDLPYPTPVPPITHIAEGGAGTPAGGTQNAGGTQGGGTDFASAGPAGNAVMDYENKGVIFFNYDDSVFTFRNSVFDGLETPYEDGNVRITFHAEYADGLEARHKWLDDYSDQPEYRSEETTIAGLPARVVHLIDSTMFNDPYMYVLIDLRGTQETYEDIFITVRGNSFEDIDADRVYAIINSIHFEP